MHGQQVSNIKSFVFFLNRLCTLSVYVLHLVTIRFFRPIFVAPDRLSFLITVINRSDSLEAVLCFVGVLAIPLCARARVCVCVWQGDRREVRARLLFIHVTE